MLRTFHPGGVVHDAKISAVDRDGAFRVRVANRGGWYRRLIANPPRRARRSPPRRTSPERRGAAS